MENNKNLFGDYLENDIELETDDMAADFEEENLPAQNNANVPSQAFNFDFSKLNIPGIVTGNIGLKVSRYAVDKTRFTVANKSLISIVSSQVIAIKCHYNQEVGSYLCFGGDCCNTDGGARVKYLFPVVVYDTDKNGRPTSSAVECRVLAVGKETYEDIMTIHELSGDITQTDLLITCKDEGYQRISIQQAGTARWKKNNAVVKQVSDFWTRNMKHIYEAVAREITPEAYRERMGMVDTGTLGGSDTDFEDVFK